MKNSSTDAGPAALVGPDLAGTGITAADVTIRPARLDRQLSAGRIAPAYSDEHLEGIVERATADARDLARSEGYAAGWAQGRQAAAAEAKAQAAAVAGQVAATRAADAQRIQAMLDELASAVQIARSAGMPEWSEVADAIADGAIQLAAAAIGRELTTVTAPLMEAVRVALRGLAEPGEAVVLLNPADAELVGNASPGVQVVADASVRRGSVVALSPAQRLQLDLPSAIAAAEEVLRS